ncbi:hypothetical protein COY43_01660 [Candidatus Berkelbacteria bacterium CG_4_10_14_0_8_um_filter_35_9_33_8]|nr:MAG: hypothetical protein COY43_01660 [Candidatus Berkelbacteria bacterium CG_4_10_14_0_8_um_filter_35_9_33_8]
MFCLTAQKAVFLTLSIVEWVKRISTLKNRLKDNVRVSVIFIDQEEHMEDALVEDADEGRSRLR